MREIRLPIAGVENAAIAQLAKVLERGQMYKDTLNVDEPMPIAELTAKATGGGRQPSAEDLALRALVEEVALKENAEKAFPWNFMKDGKKPITARAMATRAIKATGKDGIVYVGAKNDRLWFSQTPLSNRGRKRK